MQPGGVVWVTNVEHVCCQFNQRENSSGPTRNSVATQYDQPKETGGGRECTLAGLCVGYKFRCDVGGLQRLERRTVRILERVYGNCQRDARSGSCQT
jgi:hypothetical protein